MGGLYGLLMLCLHVGLNNEVHLRLYHDMTTQDFSNCKGCVWCQVLVTWLVSSTMQRKVGSKHVAFLNISLAYAKTILSMFDKCDVYYDVIVRLLTSFFACLWKHTWEKQMAKRLVSCPLACVFCCVTGCLRYSWQYDCDAIWTGSR